LSPTIVFIFGGPGTQKGKYIDCLVDLYGLRCISICKVLEEQFDEVQLYDAKGGDMKSVGISTVMQWFIDRMTKDTNAPGFIIDIVPNVKV